MKPNQTLTAAIFGISIVTTAPGASTYTDSVGELAVPGNPFPHIDISSVTVSNTPTQLSFEINLNGDPVATDWGKYLVGISTAPGGDTGSNGWTRPISMSDGMEFFIGSWVDGGNGAELHNYSGSWALNSTTYGANSANLAIAKNTSSVTLTLDLAALGLGINDTLTFDVYTSGGGGADGATDALSTPTASIANWADSYNTNASGGGSNSALSYTVVPEPSIALLGGLGLLGLLRRRR